jgi:hypothetical protein
MNPLLKLVAVFSVVLNVTCALGGFAAQAPVTVVGNFYAALASGNVATAITLICPADRIAFGSADTEQLKAYLQEFRTQQRVGLIQYPSRSLLFVRLNSQSEVLLRVIEVLPPSGSTGSCITQVDPMATLLRDLLAASMPDVSAQDFPNPYPNGIPNR